MQEQCVQFYICKNGVGFALALVGNPRTWASALQGFTARYVNCFMLALQLDTELFGGIIGVFGGYEDCMNYGLIGLPENPLKASRIEQLGKTIQPDEFGMLSFINEIIGEGLDYGL